MYSTLLIVLLLVGACLLLAHLMHAYDASVLEGFHDGPCVRCDCLWGDQCSACSNCGTCLLPSGQLLCAHGDYRGPFRRGDCAAWWFDKRRITFEPQVVATSGWAGEPQHIPS